MRVCSLLLSLSLSLTHLPLFVCRTKTLPARCDVRTEPTLASLPCSVCCGAGERVVVVSAVNAANVDVVVGFVSSALSVRCRHFSGTDARALPWHASATVTTTATATTTTLRALCTPQFPLLGFHFNFIRRPRGGRATADHDSSDTKNVNRAAPANRKQMKKCVNYDIVCRQCGTETDREREQEREIEKRVEGVQGACVGGHNLKMYKKYIKRKSPRCLCSLCACCLREEGGPSSPPPVCVCVFRSVCVWRVLITSQKVKLGQNASAAEHEPTSQCVCVCVCVCVSLFVRVLVCVCVGATELAPVTAICHHCTVGTQPRLKCLVLVAV